MSDLSLAFRSCNLHTFISETIKYFDFEYCHSVVKAESNFCSSNIITFIHSLFVRRNPIVISQRHVVLIIFSFIFYF